MPTRMIELADATKSLAEYAQHADDETIIITQNGQPIAAVVALANTDVETAALSQDAHFLRIIERSRTRQAQGGGIPSAEMRRRFAGDSSDQ